MALPQIDSTTISTPATSTQGTSKKDEATLRRMASEFESLLLNQLTSSLNPSDEDENGLFSNSGGMGLSRQMFSEQLAKTMSESGGIGLADLIVSHMNQNGAEHVKSRQGERVLKAIREIKALGDKNPVATGTTTATAATGEPAASTDTIPTGESVAASATPSASSSSVSATPASAVDISRMTRPRRVHRIESSSSVTATDSAVATATAPVTSPVEANPPKLSARHVALQMPLRGVIRSGFGARRDPINGRHRFHEGIDIAAAKGTPIGAAAAGTVVFAGRNKGYGNMVMIEHADGRRTVYAHAQRLFVKAGATVAAGQTIAAVGSTGHSTGPHLHFEIRESNRPVNPLNILANGFTVARR